MPRSASRVRTADILALAAAGELEADTRAEQALIACALVPDGGGWVRAWSRLLPALATLFAIAGAICLVAANWQSLGRHARFGAAVAVITAVTLWAIRSGLNRQLGRWLLTLAIGLIGPLLALFGQAYQTGADAHRLMFTWALLALPWLFAVRLAAAWMLVLTVVQAACLFWLAALQGWRWLPGLPGLPTWLVAVALQAALLFAWELGAMRVAWLDARWPQRLIVVVLLTVVTSVGGWALFDTEMPWRVAGLLTFFGCVAVLVVVYSRLRPEPAMLAPVLVAVTAFGATLVLRLSESLWLTSLVVLGLAGAGAWLLRVFQLGHLAGERKQS